jgi:hypothetical protein
MKLKSILYTTSLLTVLSESLYATEQYMQAVLDDRQNADVNNKRRR